MMCPSLCQMTPVPPPRPSIPTCTIPGCTRVNISTSAVEKTSGRGIFVCVSRFSLWSSTVVCVIAYLPVVIYSNVVQSLFSLSYGNLEGLQASAANDIDGNGFVHAITCEQDLEVL